MIIIINEKTILKVFLVIVIPLFIGYLLSSVVYDSWYYIKYHQLGFLFKPEITKLNMTMVNENLIPSKETVGTQFPALNNSKVILENITGDQKSFAVHLIERGIPPHDWLYKENPCEIKIIKWCVKQ